MATGFQACLFPCRGLAVFTAFAALAGGQAADTDEAARRVGILFEGSFEAADVSRAPEGARSTQMAASYEWDYGVRHFTEAGWKERGFDWERFLAVATEVAGDVLEKVEPVLVRDDRDVVEYAILADQDPFLTSVILSPKLLERFQETLGDRVLAVLLDRHRVYLFPATGGRLPDFGPALVEEYGRTDLPVSLEVFLVDEDGYRVVGELERPQ